MAFHENLITEPLESINDTLDGIRFVYFPPSTDGSAASVDRYDRDGHVKIECVGTPRECWQFVSGLEAALEVTNRLPVG